MDGGEVLDGLSMKGLSYSCMLEHNAKFNTTYSSAIRAAHCAVLYGPDGPVPVPLSVWLANQDGR